MSPATAAAHRGRAGSAKPSSAPARCSSSMAGPWRVVSACCSGVCPHLPQGMGQVWDEVALGGALVGFIKGL